MLATASAATGERGSVGGDEAVAAVQQPAQREEDDRPSRWRAPSPAVGGRRGRAPCTRTAAGPSRRSGRRPEPVRPRCRWGDGASSTTTCRGSWKKARKSRESSRTTSGSARRPCRTRRSPRSRRRRRRRPPRRTCPRPTAPGRTPAPTESSRSHPSSSNACADVAADSSGSSRRRARSDLVVEHLGLDERVGVLQHGAAGHLLPRSESAPCRPMP